MKVLVTGACGFIGINLCKKLIAENKEVVGIDNFSGDYSKNQYAKNREFLECNKKALFVEGDILDKEKILSFSDTGITHIVHLAAKTGVRDSVLHPKRYIETNIIGTQNILDLAIKDKIKSVVLASTSSVYGKNKTPFNESMSFNTPLSPYAATKIGMESLAYSYYSIFNLPVTVLRFFTVYGPMGRPDMAVYKFSKLINEGKPIDVFGDGSAKRDFTYVDDVVNGVISSMSLNKGFNVFNIGCSKKVTVSGLIKLIEKNLGKKAKINYIDSKPEDAHETLANISKAKKIIGYVPKIELDEGIKRFVDWFVKQ